ncbi:hypothetical protein JCM17380_34890 [Desulfosporosinus burensis]
MARGFRLSTSRYNHLYDPAPWSPIEMSPEGRKKRMDEMLKLVANFGFPIVVSAYLLVRIEGKLGELTQSITELAKAIAVMKS